MSDNTIISISLEWDTETLVILLKILGELVFV